MKLWRYLIRYFSKYLNKIFQGSNGKGPNPHSPLFERAHHPLHTFGGSAMKICVLDVIQSPGLMAYSNFLIISMQKRPCAMCLFSTHVARPPVSLELGNMGRKNPSQPLAVIIAPFLRREAISSSNAALSAASGRTVHIM